MKLTRTSIITHQEHTMDLNCTQEQFNEGQSAYAFGALLQDAYPFLSKEEREFVKTGITAEEWDKYMREPDSDKDENEENNGETSTGI